MAAKFTNIRLPSLTGSEAQVGDAAEFAAIFLLAHRLQSFR
jgi:hypothetical protein